LPALKTLILDAVGLQLVDLRQQGSGSSMPRGRYAGPAGRRGWGVQARWVGQGFFHGVALAHGAHPMALGHDHLLLAVKDRRESLGGGGAQRR
jgi:hypothetical protein